MSYFDLYIQDNTIKEIECVSKEDYKFNKINIKTLGHFCGIVLGKDILEKDAAIEEINKAILSNNKKQLNYLMSNIVGPCYILIEDGNDIKLFASPSSYGLLYGKVNDQYYFSNYEGRFYKNFSRLSNKYSFNDMMLLNSVTSHHSVIRAPFHGIIDETFRCPPGCSLKIKDNDLSDDCFIMQEYSDVIKNEINDSNLQEIFRNVACLISKSLDYKSNNFKIAFSGGIDSSLLLSLFYQKVKNKNLLFYKNYGAKQEKELASAIAKSMNQNMEIIEKNPEIDFDFIVKKGKSGLGTILGEEYLKLGGTSSPFSSSNQDKNKFSITGQNADTLFHIDHFGPDNREMGISRFLYVIYFMHKRIYYSMPYYLEKWWLKFFPFFVPKKRFNKNIFDLLKSTFSGIDEHVGPFEEETIKTPSNIDRKKFQEFRKEIFFTPLNTKLSNNSSCKFFNI